jgi:hypothetical protein
MFYSGRAAIRTVLALLCCTTCVGVVAIIMGVVMLLQPNDHHALHKDYEAALAEYEASPSSARLKQSRVRIVGDPHVAFNLVSLPVKLTDGSKQGASTALLSNSTVDVSVEVQVRLYYLPSAAATLPPASTKATTNTTLVETTSLGSFNRQQRLTVFANCPKLTADDSKQKRDAASCSKDEMDRRCREKSRASCATCGASARAGGKCACTWFEFPASICKPLAFDAVTQQWAVDKSVFSGTCDYGGKQRMHCFNSAAEGTDETSSVTVRFIASDDPYIALQRITEGAAGFGRTLVDQAKAALIVMLVGVGMITVVAMLVLVGQQIIKKNLGKRERFFTAVPLLRRWDPARKLNILDESGDMVPLTDGINDGDGAVFADIMLDGPDEPATAVVMSGTDRTVVERQNGYGGKYGCKHAPHSTNTDVVASLNAL